MKVETFDIKSSLVVVQVTVKVKDAIKKYDFAVDTGASNTRN